MAKHYHIVLKESDLPFWRRVQAQAAAEGRSVRFVIMTLLKNWLESNEE